MSDDSAGNGEATAQTPDDAGPLSGVRVLALEHCVAAPYCSQIFADQGAEVIKVEAPDGELRRGYFSAVNRNKRSIILDLKELKDRQAFLDLVRTADVLVTNYGANVPARLNVDFESLRPVNAGLVYIHIAGFGKNSPYRDVPAFDGIIQAMSGMMALIGEPDVPPMLSGLFIPDHITGVWAATGVALGLLRRARTGQGSFYDLSMLDGLLAFHGLGLADVLDNGKSPNRIGSKVRGRFASTYEAKDGYVYLCPLTPPMWQTLCTVIERPDLGVHHRPSAPEVDTRGRAPGRTRRDH